MLNLAEVFEKFNDDYIKFERVENKLSGRPDLHAFLLLDKLMPGTRDMVSAAEHDEIYLDVDCEKLADIASEDDILALTRCGVRYDEGTDSLCMFA